MDPAHTHSASMADSTIPSPTQHDVVMNDVSSQMAASQLSRRLSRSSGSQAVTSTPSRRSVRVEKPRSSHNSPRFLERRKTTSFVKKHVTLDDHFRMMFGDSTEVDSIHTTAPPPSRASGRPVSWHPSSSHYGHLTSPEWNGYQSSAIDQDCTIHSASDFQSAYSCFSSPQLPINNGLHLTPSAAYARSNMTSPAWDRASNTGMVYSELEQPCYFSLNDSTADWQARSKVRPDSEVSPNNGLYIQQDVTENDSDLDESPEDKELVGMGLYDPPEAIHSWLDSGVAGSGKGLKLQETWEPPEDKDGEADAEEDDDSPEDMAAPEAPSSDDESMDEPQAPVPSTQQWSLPTSKPAPVKNLSGQSFLFDDEDSFGTPVWIGQQQLKQSSAQPTGFGYAWV